MIHSACRRSPIARIGVVWTIAAVSVLVAGCDVVLAPAPPASTAPVPPTAPPAPGSVAEQLAALPIAVEDTGAHYDRDEWAPRWAEADGCTTREQVLRQQGTGVVVDDECRPVAGEWVSPYDGVRVTDPRELEIDHVVPLAEVARSGPVVNGRRVRPGEWPEEQRRAYANDVAGLLAVTESSNASKSDSDPAKWLPDNDRCGYVARWVAVKTAYGLSVDQAEHDAIAGVLASCPA